MALVIHFAPRNMDARKYAEVLRRLEAAGEGAPRGRLHHTSYGPAEQLSVVDVFDTMQSFEAFGGKLVPILQGLGIDMGPPDIKEVHHIIRGG
jgi:hypothetical protein